MQIVQLCSIHANGNNTFQIHSNEFSTRGLFDLHAYCILTVELVDGRAKFQETLTISVLQEIDTKNHNFIYAFHMKTERG